MCLLYVYVIRQGPNQYPSCALTWTRTSLVQCTPQAQIHANLKQNFRSNLI
jgi:hypothetical protein